MINKTAIWHWYGHNLADDFIFDGVECSNCHYKPAVRAFAREKLFLRVRDFEISEECPKCGCAMTIEED